MTKVLVGCALILLHLASFADEKNPPLVVETVVAKTEKLVVERHYMGRISAENFAVLKPEQSATVDQIAVQAGQLVKKGDTLVVLQSASQVRGLGLMKENVSSLSQEYARKSALHKSGDISKAEVDRSHRELLSAKTQLEQAQRELSYRKIIAPFDGEVGVPRVGLGQSVTPQTEIISLKKPPYSLTFFVSAARLSEVTVGQRITSGSEETIVSAVEKSIDETRMGFAKGIFDKCTTCIVGASVPVTLTVFAKDNAIMLPTTAIFYQAKAPYAVVAIEKEGGFIADVRAVKVGEEQEGRVEILEGIKAGERVVEANPKRVNKGAALKVEE